jgi:hypothetical protein
MKTYWGVEAKFYAVLSSVLVAQLTPERCKKEEDNLDLFGGQTC